VTRLEQKRNDFVQPPSVACLVWFRALMWFGITYLTKHDGIDDEQVIVSIWDDHRPLRVGGPARCVADIVCALRQAGGSATAVPRCDGCGREFDLPDLDAEQRATA
jgi:hypothetical protein